jgi:hypothetical protein
VPVKVNPLVRVQNGGVSQKKRRKEVYSRSNAVEFSILFLTVLKNVSRLNLKEANVCNQSH